MGGIEMIFMNDSETRLRPSSSFLLRLAARMLGAEIFIFLTLTCLSARAVRAADLSGIVSGSTGFACVSMPLLSEPDPNSASETEIEAGTPFLIEEEYGDYWKASFMGFEGFVPHALCAVNLPDVLPDVFYEIANASSCMYASSGKSLSVTGMNLYGTGRIPNQRLGRDEYVVPVLYSTARMLADADDAARSRGFALRIYDAYRPKSVSVLARDSLAELYASDEDVRRNIDSDSLGNAWGQGWFIAQNSSSHNFAAAVDVAPVDPETGEDLPCPSPMHELSSLAAKFSSPSESPYSESGYAPSMTPAAIALTECFIESGFRGLASEWWHFQDQEGYERMRSVVPDGMDWFPSEVVSEELP